MLRLALTLLALILVVICPLTYPAQADLIYTFSTSSPAPLAGPVSGSFVVSDAAILDGFITASEFRSFGFTLPFAASPFTPATFAAPDPLAIGSPFAGAIMVDPITGHFTADALIQITDSTTAQRLGLTTFPGTVPPLVPQYTVSTSNLGQTTQGSGAWTVSQIPEPGTMLLVLSGIVGVFVLRQRK